MDGSLFDRIARSLATERSRRGVLGGLLGLGAGLVGVRATDAACPPGQVSRPRVGCVCRRTGRPPVGGVCPCPRGQTDTGDGQGCLECRGDDECGDACAGAGPCVQGACTSVPTLPEGASCTDGRVCLDGACRGNGTCTTSSTCEVVVPCPGSGCNIPLCHTTSEGGLVCADDTTDQDLEPCTSSADCPAGDVCVTSACLDPVCMRVCGG
jgi:hypothetical protein